MDKPEDIPSGIWDMAYGALHPITKKNYEISPHAMVQHLGIARAILSAQSQAYIDAARIAEGIGEKLNDKEVEGWLVSERISAAILQRKEEME